MVHAGGGATLDRGQPLSTVGVVANPMAGRDVRRLLGRALQQTPEMKRNQIQRAVVGAVAAGARRVVLMRDCFRTSQSAIEGLRLHAEVSVLDGPIDTTAADTAAAVARLRELGCGALVVLGGDGTNRIVARTWRDAPIVPVSTGTNNVFPEPVEATSAGAAAGCVANGTVPADEAARPCKRVEVEFADGARDLALIDLAVLEGDHPGSLLAFDPEQLRQLVLTRGEPAAVGTSPIGGLLEPVTRDEDCGVRVTCTAPGGGGRALLFPVSPGLYRTAHVREAGRLPLGEWTQLRGPGVVALDGDRQRRLAQNETLRARVVRDGPRVIDVAATLAIAAQRAAFSQRPPWHDDVGGDFDCC